MKIQTGEVITLSNNKEYICCATASENDVDYVYLMSNFKPLEIRFARQKVVDGQVEVTIVGNPEEKQKILKLFQDTMKQ